MSIVLPVLFMNLLLIVQFAEMESLNQVNNVIVSIIFVQTILVVTVKHVSYWLLQRAQPWIYVVIQQHVNLVPLATNAALLKIHVT